MGLDEVACWFVWFFFFDLNPINSLSVFLSLADAMAKAGYYSSSGAANTPFLNIAF